MGRERRKAHCGVRMTGGRVIEFQHSRIAPEERRAREAFYGSMAWIVDGLRRSRDRERLHASLAIVCRTPLICIASPSRCALLRDWAASHADVFLDLYQRPLIMTDGPIGAVRET